MKKINYQKAGVSIKKGELFARKIKIAGPKAFGSLFNLKPLLKKYRNPILVSSTDGVGTKLKIAQELRIHHTVGIDLVAMSVNDVVCLGARPLFFLDYIACGKLNLKTMLKLMVGIKKGLRLSDCPLLGGETAEMPGMYKPDEYDLAGFCVGIVDKHKVIDGKNIKAGDLIIGLESSGLHSNGFSLVRKTLGSKGIKKYVKELLIPTRIYVKPILSLLENTAVKGIAHITGGAFYNKATKILPLGLGMVINKKNWSLPKIFEIIQDRGDISEKEMYSVFNMGIGMMVVVDKRNARPAVKYLNRMVKARLIGEIAKSSQRMVLR